MAGCQRRRMRFETLERRQVLSSLWQNPSLHLDVNGDGLITPQDVLIAVNHINANPGDPSLPDPTFSTTIEKVIDTDSDRLSLSGFATIRVHDKTVLFHGLGPGGYQGLFIYDGQELAVVADTTTVASGRVGPFTQFSAPSLDADGVAFATVADDTDMIYAKLSGELRLVADDTTVAPNGRTFSEHVDQPSLVSGRVVFSGVTDGMPKRGVFNWDDGVITSVATTEDHVPEGTGTFTFAGSAPASFDGDTVAFRGANDRSTPSQNGVYVNRDDELIRIADLTSPVPDPADESGEFVDFDTPSVSNDHVAFRAVTSAGAGIFASFADELVAVADTTTTIPDGTGEFVNFGRPAIDGTSIAFQGLGSEGQDGIYLRLGHRTLKIINKADLLDGKEISNFRFYRRGLSGSTLAFGVEFIDGTQGVYTASVDAVPPPYLDTSGDCLITPQDVLLIINFLNDRGEGEDRVLSSAAPPPTNAVLLEIDTGSPRATLAHEFHESGDGLGIKIPVGLAEADSSGRAVQLHRVDAAEANDEFDDVIDAWLSPILDARNGEELCCPEA